MDHNLTNSSRKFSCQQDVFYVLLTGLHSSKVSGM